MYCHAITDKSPPSRLLPCHVVLLGALHCCGDSGRIAPMARLCRCVRRLVNAIVAAVWFLLRIPLLVLRLPCTVCRLLRSLRRLGCGNVIYLIALTLFLILDKLGLCKQLKAMGMSWANSECGCPLGMGCFPCTPPPPCLSYAKVPN